jgi:hypothetical protein
MLFQLPTPLLIRSFPLASEKTRHPSLFRDCLILAASYLVKDSVSQQSLSPPEGRELIIVPGTADGFRANVSDIGFFHGSKCVGFHTFALPEDAEVRLLIKKLGRQMLESVVREDLEALDISVQGIMQIHSGRRDLYASKYRHLSPHVNISVAWGLGVQKVRSFSELCGLRVSVETYVALECPVQCKQCQLFGHTQRYCCYAPRCFACAETHTSGECSAPKQQLICCSCWGQPHGQLPALQQVERDKSGACKASAQATHPDQRCCRSARRE